METYEITKDIVLEHLTKLFNDYKFKLDSWSIDRPASQKLIEFCHYVEYEPTGELIITLKGRYCK